MGKRCEHFIKEDTQKADKHEKMLNTINHYSNADQTTMDITTHPLEWLQ